MRVLSLSNCFRQVLEREPEDVGSLLGISDSTRREAVSGDDALQCCRKYSGYRSHVGGSVLRDGFSVTNPGRTTVRLLRYWKKQFTWIAVLLHGALSD